MLTVFIFLYKSLALFKHTLLVSVFGFSSYCKHTPTCSEYALLQTRKHGTINGLWKGFQRLVTCW